MTFSSIAITLLNRLSVQYPLPLNKCEYTAAILTTNLEGTGRGRVPTIRHYVAWGSLAPPQLPRRHPPCRWRYWIGRLRLHFSPTAVGDCRRYLPSWLALSWPSEPSRRGYLCLCYASAFQKRWLRLLLTEKQRNSFCLDWFSLTWFFLGDTATWHLIMIGKCK